MLNNSAEAEIKTSRDAPFDNGYALIWLENGVLRGEYKPRTIDLEGAEAIIRDRKVVANNTPMPAVIDGRNVKEVLKSARDKFATEEGSELLTAVALVANSVFTRHLGNFFILISYRNGKVPIRLFNDVEPAMKWAEQYKEKS